MSGQRGLFDEESHLPEREPDPLGSMGPPGLSAYIASPITNANQATTKRIDLAVAALEELLPALDFVRVHVPKYYTSPEARPDMGGREVARVDKDLLIGSDLIIFLAEDSSTGSGMEIAWSVDGGLYLLIEVSGGSETHPSRIAAGSSDRAVENRYTSINELKAQVEKFVKDNKAALIAHSEWRSNAPTALLPLQQNLTPISSGLRRNADAGRDYRHLATDAKLVDLCADSVAHLAGLTIGEYLRLELASGAHPFQTIVNAYSPGLVGEMAEGLLELDEFQELSGADVLDLILDAERDLTGATTRVDFSDPEFWRRRLGQ